MMDMDNENSMIGTEMKVLGLWIGLGLLVLVVLIIIIIGIMFCAYMCGSLRNQLLLHENQRTQVVQASDVGHFFRAVGDCIMGPLTLLLQFFQGIVRDLRCCRGEGNPQGEAAYRMGTAGNNAEPDRRVFVETVDA